MRGGSGTFQVHNILQDTRVAGRALIRRPGFAAAGGPFCSTAVSVPKHWRLTRSMKASLRRSASGRSWAEPSSQPTTPPAILMSRPSICLLAPAPTPESEQVSSTPAKASSSGIHVEAICQHLQAVAEGRLGNLIITPSVPANRRVSGRKSEETAQLRKKSD